jgi:hypothetical protein
MRVNSRILKQLIKKRGVTYRLRTNPSRTSRFRINPSRASKLDIFFEADNPPSNLLNELLRLGWAIASVGETAPMSKQIIARLFGKAPAIHATMALLSDLQQIPKQGAKFRTSQTRRATTVRRSKSDDGRGGTS